MKQEWEPLLNFMESKNVRIANLDQARQGPSFALAGRSLAGIVDEDDDDEDEFGAGVADEEDEDFKGAGASSDDSSDNDSDAELIPEDGISVEAVGGAILHAYRKRLSRIQIFTICFYLKVPSWAIHALSILHLRTGSCPVGVDKCSVSFSCHSAR